MKIGSNLIDKKTKEHATLVDIKKTKKGPLYCIEYIPGSHLLYRRCYKNHFDSLFEILDNEINFYNVVFVDFKNKKRVA